MPLSRSPSLTTTQSAYTVRIVLASPRTTIDAHLHACRRAELKAGQVKEAASGNLHETPGGAEKACQPGGCVGGVPEEAGSKCTAPTACEAGRMAAGVSIALPHHPMVPPAPCQSHQAPSGHSSDGCVAGCRGYEISPEDIADLLRRYAGTCGVTGSRLRGGGGAVIDVGSSVSMAGSSAADDDDVGHQPDTPPAMRSRSPPVGKARRRASLHATPTRAEDAQMGNTDATDASGKGGAAGKVAAGSSVPVAMAGGVTAPDATATDAQAPVDAGPCDVTTDPDVLQDVVAAGNATMRECDAEMEHHCGGGSLSDPAVYEKYALPAMQRESFFIPVASARGVQVPVWHTRVDVYRVKTALMATVNNMGAQVRGDPKAVAMGNVAHRAAPRWSDPATGDDTEWWHSIPSRTATGKEAVARVFHTWVRAYVVALEANARVSGDDGKGCREIMGALKAPHNRDSNGFVKMGAVIESFASCPGDVVFHTLCLLNWSGHVCANGTINTLNYAITCAVLAYWAGRSRRYKDAGFQVRRSPGRAACVNVVFLCTCILPPRCVQSSCLPECMGIVLKARK